MLDFGASRLPSLLVFFAGIAGASAFGCSGGSEAQLSPSAASGGRTGPDAGTGGAAATATGGAATGGTSFGTGGAPTSGGGPTGGTSGSGGAPIDAGTGGGAARDGAVLDGAPSDAASDAIDAAACSATEKVCGGTCVDRSDPAFGCTARGCSPCGAAAGTVAACERAKCAVAGCAPGDADCDGDLTDGCESVLASDGTNCSACGNPCVPPNATGKCAAGACAVARCNTGFADCDGNAANGCEADTKNDPAHCGGCTTKCTATPGATAACHAGVCADAICSVGLADCDNDLKNGCETNIGSDVENCGACGHSCDGLANATGKCRGGVCAIASCAAGFADCNGNPADGCETNLATNALHCGACKRPCSSTGASSARCDGGECFHVCDLGAGDCSHPDAPAADDGCETNTAGDPANCGGCGAACTVPNGTPGCVASACTVTNCPPGTDDCDGDPTNGCETDLTTSADHCGACSRACSSSNVVTRTCASGVCTSTCGNGFDNCSRPASPSPDDGCEHDVSSDPDNCGACGRACSAANVLSRSCAAGVCNSTCALGSGNCKEPVFPSPDDGCETDVSTDSTRCGSCTNDCTTEGGGGSGLRCASASGSPLCGCAGNAGRCNQSGATGTCGTDGFCQCGGVACGAGEGCVHAGTKDTCTCNGGSACGAGTVCCATPSGCRDLTTDPASCGACGRACTPGFACSAGQCACDADADCNAGTAGTCDAAAGLCTCNGTTCTEGQRCQSDGSCG